MNPHARIGFSAHETLKRSDFGMGFGVPQPGSTMGVGHVVEFTIEAEFSGPAWAGAGNAAVGSLELLAGRRVRYFRRAGTPAGPRASKR